MSATPFIAFSLILMVIIAVLALFLSGKRSDTANWDDPTAKKGRPKYFRRF